MQPEIQNQVDQKILDQLNEHPASAGKVVDAVRESRGLNINNGI